MSPSARCLLASAPHRDTFGYSMPPPGLLRLGGELKRRGRAVALEDLAYRCAAGELALDDELGPRAAELLAARAAELGEGPLLIGLSTMGATLPAALVIAAALRERVPDAVIALGGPGCGGIDVALLQRFDQVDLVVRGEGEETLPELLLRIDPLPSARVLRARDPRARAADGPASGPSGANRTAGRVRRSRGARTGDPRALDLRSFPGVTWRDAAGAVRREADRPQLADLSNLAEPAWDLVAPLTEYKRITGEAEGLTPIDSGRGCAYDCSFCSIGRYWGRRSRVRPPELVAAEVLALVDHPGAKNAYLCHDLFGAERKQALIFCALLEDAGAPVPWECRARVDHLDGELLDAMGRAGCYRVLLGIESGDGALRNRHDKHMDAGLDVLAVVRRAAAAGVTPILSCILGLPGETDVELAATLDTAADAALTAGVNLSFHLPNPQPGCRLGDERGETRSVEGIPPDMAFGAGASGPERALIEAHPDLFSTWHLLTDGDGGVERLQELATIQRELAPALMRYPRTFAALRRGTDAADGTRTDSLALFRAWRASGLSFEGFALQHARRIMQRAQSSLVRELLAWEHALLRQAARSADATRAADATDLTPGLAGELVHATHDLPAVAAALQDGAPLPSEPSPTTLAVVSGRSGVGAGPGCRTLRVTPDVERVLALLDGRSLETLEQDAPGVAAALERLATAGLVRLPIAPTAAPTAKPPASTPATTPASTPASTQPGAANA